MSKDERINNITAVVCARNSASTIEQCLKSLREAGIRSIILVDGKSTDETIKKASPYADKILTDPGMGLAEARNVGIREVRTEYVANIGSDNIISAECISEMLRELMVDGIGGVSCMTSMRSAVNYISIAQNIYKRSRFYPGVRSVIGTPNVFRTSTLIENPYDPKMGHSDDGDLCMRLTDMGYKFKIANIVAYEIGFENIKSIIERWGRYGLSDYQTYRKYSTSWGFLRKLASILYPARVEIFQPFTRLKLNEYVYIFPFLLLITSVRYSSWIKMRILKS